jgi:putative copper resistance protein D
VIDPLAIARAIHLAATTVAAGMIFFELVIARPAFGSRTAKAGGLYFTTLHRWIWVALALTAVSGFAWALLVAAEISNGSTAQVLADGTLAKLLTETRFGQVWLWRGACLFATALLLLSKDRRAGWIRLISASAFLSAIACVGHSGAQLGAIGWLQLGADVAHLLAAGLWLGSLPGLALLLASREFAKSSTATRRFSSFGILAVVTLLLTGLFNTYLLTDGITSLPDSAYGRLLLLKVAVFAGMVALATINRCYWTPKLPGRPAVLAIRRHSTIEAAMGLAVLVIVGLLGTLPPPAHAHLHASTGDEGTFVHIHDSRGMAEVRLVPGVPGQNDAEIRLMQEDFSPLTAKSVELRLSLPGQPAIAAQATAVGDGLWRVPGLALPAAGVWTVVVVIGRQDIAPLALDGPIVVDPGSAQKSE